MTKRKMARRVGNRRAWAVRFLLIALAAFLFLKAVQIYGQLHEKGQELITVEQKIQRQKADNEAEEEKLTPENLEENLLNDSYDQNNARPGDQFFVIH